MADGGTQTFTDPDSFAAAFGDNRVTLTITGAGAFRAELTSLQLQHLKIYRFREKLPRIGYISTFPELISLSFPIKTTPARFGGFAVREGEFVSHSPSERVHQRFNDACQWGLIALSPEYFADCSKALVGRSLVSQDAGKFIRPPRTEVSRFHYLFKQACHLAGKKLIERPEVARALEQEMLHAIIRCLAAGNAVELPKVKSRHAAVMIRFEEALSKLAGNTPSMSQLCAEIGVAERTLRQCCAEFIDLSPTRYLFLHRLNKARAALQRADPSTASVAEIARDHQFLELGRFAVIYRTTFGELPSVTLHRNPRV